MKNIHILPTDKEPVKGDLLLRHIWKNNPKLECKSWWRYKETITIDYLKQYTTLNGSFRDAVSSFKVQKIYITSDEEIKEGDWCMSLCDDESYEEIYQCKDVSLVDKEDKKIILTTDQDLIADGVQAIDDEFLEWFVENPSCEFVGVKPLLSNNGRALFGYKIIIPKEEPKQDEIMERFIANAKQQERSYSEEEVFHLLVKVIKDNKVNQLSFFDNGISNPIYTNLNKWFEQYKNK
jgi:hypothetical protein